MCSSGPEPELMMHASTALIREPLFIEQSGANPELARRTVGILMASAWYGDHLWRLCQLVHQSGLWLLLRSRAAWSGTDCQDSVGFPLPFRRQSMNGAHSNHFACVHSEEMFAGARMDAKPRAPEAPGGELGLATLFLFRRC